MIFLKKEFKLEDSIKAVKIAKSVRIPVLGSFIIGIPGETIEIINQTISFVKKLKVHSLLRWCVIEIFSTLSSLSVIFKYRK